MSFSRPTLSEIYGRIKADLEARVTDGNRIPRYSLLGILTAVFAGAVWSLYGYLTWLGDQLFPETADDEYIENHAARFGLSRKAAAYAAGVVRFDGTPGVTVPEGTEVQTSGGVIYTTDADATIGGGGSITAAITAADAGTAGNTTDATLSLVNPLSGVNTECTITTAPVGGTDLETTADLRARVIQRTANPPSSGTASDYVRWALEVSGVGRAWCLPAEQYKGAGTVGVVIATSALAPVDSTVHDAAVEYLEAVRPIGAILTVEDVIPSQVDYAVSITPNTSATRAAVTAALEQLHIDEATPGGTLYLSHINAAIMSAGVDNARVTDISVDLVSVGVDDVTVPGHNVATFRGATYSDLS